MHDLQNEPLLVFPDGFPNQRVVTSALHYLLPKRFT